MTRIENYLELRKREAIDLTKNLIKRIKDCQPPRILLACSQGSMYYELEDLIDAHLLTPTQVYEIAETLV